MAQFVVIFEGPTLAKAKPVLTSTDRRVVEAVLKSIEATIKDPVKQGCTERGWVLANTPRGTSKYPWPEMQIGDSILIVVDGVSRMRLQTRLANSARLWLNKNDITDRRIATKQVEGGVRVSMVARSGEQ